MGCCGGGFNNNNQEQKGNNVNRDGSSVKSKVNIMPLVYIGLILGLIYYLAR